MKNTKNLEKKVSELEQVEKPDDSIRESKFVENGKTYIKIETPTAEFILPDNGRDL